MTADTDRRRGFRVTDLIAVILVIAVLMAMFVSFDKSARETARRTACQNNMRQLGLGLLNWCASRNRFPNAGTIFDDPEVHQGDPAKSNIYISITDPGKLADGGRCWLHGWVVDISSYLDYAGLANAWDYDAPFWQPSETIEGEPANAHLSSLSMGVLRCPADPTIAPGLGNLSYVVNGGFTRWPAIPIGWRGGQRDGQSGNGSVLHLSPEGASWQENLAVGRRLGVMFLGTQTGDQPWDIKTTQNDLVDGASETLLLGENTLTGYSMESAYTNRIMTGWTCPLPNFTMFLGSDNVCDAPGRPGDCLAGQLAPRAGKQNGPGWALANRVGTFENINYGRNLTVKGSFPFATSYHRGGSNFVFCDGSTRFLSATIDGSVYARLITPAGSQLPPSLRQGRLSPGDCEW